MLPVVLNPAYVRVALVGAGSPAVKRLATLRGCGFDPVVYAPVCDAGAVDDAAAPSDIADAAGDALIRRNPTDDELSAINVLFVAGLPAEPSRALADRARALRASVNVEDDLPYCDFHMPAVVRRGDLLLSVSTGGRGPGLAGLLRRKLEELFPPVWAARMTELAALRDRLRGEGADGAAVNRAVARTVEENGWLP